MVQYLAVVLVGSSLVLGTPQDGKDPAAQPCQGEECTDDASALSEVREIDGKKVRVIYKKSEMLDMDGADVIGDVDGPRIRYIRARGPSHFSAQIQERANFKVELLGALEKI